MLDVAFDSVVTMDDRGIVLSANRAAERLFGYTAAEMVGRELAELIIPPSLRERTARALALPEDRARAGRGAARGADRDARDGTEFPVELVVTRPERPARCSTATCAISTARYVAEAALHRLADEQAALRRVATAVAAESESARLFALVSEEVGRLLEARTAHMFRFDSDGRGGNDRRRLGDATGARPAGRHADAARRRHGRDARVADRQRGADGHLRRRRGRAGATLRGYGVQAVVAAPVFLGGALWGAVIVSTLDPRAVPRDAEQRISYFAELAAQALANAQAREELAASRARIVAAGDAERRRLERNLHDGAQQRLVSLALMLRLAARRHPDDGDLSLGRRGARARAAGAARAGPRHPSRGPDRARARARGARGRRPRAGAGRAHGRLRGAPARGRSRPPPTTWSPRR